MGKTLVASKAARQSAMEPKRPHGVGGQLDLPSGDNFVPTICLSNDSTLWRRGGSRPRGSDRLPSPRTSCGGDQQHPDRDVYFREPRASEGDQLTTGRSWAQRRADCCRLKCKGCDVPRASHLSGGGPPSARGDADCRGSLDVRGAPSPAPPAQPCHRALRLRWG